MSDEDIQTKGRNPVNVAFRAAVIASGREAAQIVIVAHGGTNGPGGWRYVPANKADACIAALDKLAAKGGVQPTRGKPAAFAAGDRKPTLATIAAQAFPNQKPTPPANDSFPSTFIDPVAIFDRWNSTYCRKDQEFNDGGGYGDEYHNQD